MQNEEDGLESFPLEPGNSAGPSLAPDGDWMNAFPDERLTDVVVIDHKTVSVPPAPLVYVGKRTTSAERALELLRRHAMAASLVALTVLVAPVAILIGARGRDARPLATNAVLLGETSSREASADRHSLGVGGPPAAALNLSGISAREGKASAPAPTPALRNVEPDKSPQTGKLKPPAAATVPRTTAPAAAKSTTTRPMPPPAPISMAVPTPIVTPAPTLPTSTPVATPTPSPTPTSTPTSTSTPRAASDIPTAPPAPTGREVETAAIKLVLDRYRQAFDTLSVAPVEAYWPSINAKGLTRAFGQLDSQTVTFDSCDFDINREQAAATCIGRAKFTTKVGSRTPNIESRRWAFRLARMSDRWVILSVDSR
jgi:hypothetical protein